ncbi:MAG: HD domain-containing protein [Bacteroidales bacterium]|nr:HD domain-containing protein [Bacteroidales bacterium]
MKNVEISNLEKLWIESQYKEILDSSVRVFNDVAKDRIKNAVYLAYEAHHGQKRKTGEDYIIHPISVAKIVAKDMLLGSRAIAAALLHDVVEDNEDYSIEDIENQFGKDVAVIVKGLTKISKIEDGYLINENNVRKESSENSKQQENFRHLLLSMVEDFRVVYIKIADRLHNMRTITAMISDKQHKIASETLSFYVPIAERLGLYLIKMELEDLAFKIVDTEDYYDIIDEINSTKKEREEFIENSIKKIKELFGAANSKFEIYGRLKSAYSIHKKKEKKKLLFKDIFDIFAIRIVFDDSDFLSLDDETYNKQIRLYSMQIAGIITNKFRPNDDRRRDWVLNPKPNGYTAYHITVMIDGRWVEVQIRSQKNDCRAENGVAAHWKYKVNNESNRDDALEPFFQTIKEAFDKDINGDSDELFVNSIAENINAKTIPVFSPKGKMILMPKNSTILDFAFKVHPEIGFHAIGASVNGQIKSLSYTIKSCDQIDILTSAKSFPKKEWIDEENPENKDSGIVRTLEARRIVSKWLKENENSTAVIDGLSILNSMVEEMNLIVGSKELKQIREHFNAKDLNHFYSKLALKEITVESLKEELKKIPKNLEIEKFIIAKCCNPIIGNEIIAFEKNNKIIVHRKNCPECIKQATKFGDKLKTITWDEIIPVIKKDFLVTIQILGSDKKGMLLEITKIISDKIDINMKSLNFTVDKSEFVGEIALYVKNTIDIEDVISFIKRIDGVITCSEIKNKI